MNVAIFGGTFDPVHLAHVKVARVAAERYKLGRIYFVPADLPPHKQKQPLAPYYHRFAMLSIALAGEKKFIPSLLEAPEIIQAEGALASYSIDTVRRFKQGLKKSDKLFFLIGIDAFMDIAKWRSPVELLKECEFIVASRPGFSLAHVAEALPEELRPAAQVARIFHQQDAKGQLVLAGTTIHLMDDVKEPLSATKVRATANAGRALLGSVGAGVAEYIAKAQLYKAGPADPGNPVPPQPKKRASEKDVPKEERAQLHIVAGRAGRKK